VFWVCSSPYILGEFLHPEESTDRPGIPPQGGFSLENAMESFRQALGAVYVALAEAAGGDAVLHDANLILTDAVNSGAIDDPYAREAIMALVRSSQLEAAH